MSFTSPNSREIDFLQSKDKSDEYMSHIRTLQLNEHVVVFDVGANIGAFSVSIAKHLHSNVQVYAFEPFQEPYEHLLKNITGLPIEAINNAVMSTEGSIVGSYLPNYTLLSGFYVDDNDKSALEAICGHDLNNEFTAIKENVTAVRLDKFMESRNINTIDILKIDVEKSELDVLYSIGDKLANINSIVAEVHENNLDNFISLLKTRFTNVIVGDKDLPKFCIETNKVPDVWPTELNTFIVFAY